MSLFSATAPRFEPPPHPHPPTSHCFMCMAALDLRNATKSNLRLFASDFFPSPPEQRSMRCSLLEKEQSINTLDIQIASLEALVTELIARRATLVESSTIQTALLSPIRKLVPEILGEIFEYCVLSTDGPSLVIEESLPLLLGQVCKRWRRVASQTPRLWTTLNCGPQSKVNPLVVIPTWLRNSGSLPIDISLGGLEKLYHSRTHGKAFRSCLRMLNAHFHRCRTFHGTNSATLSTLFPVTHCTNASSLREFRIAPLATFEGSFALGEIAAPNLEVIDVSQPYTFFDSITTDHTLLRVLRWDASMSSGSREHSFNTLSELLTSRPNVQECELKLPPGLVDTSVGEATVTLSKLRRLSLSFPMTVDPGDLFSIIDAPALEYLALEQTSAISRGPDLSRTLRCLVSTTSPQLREIHLTRMIFSSGDVIVAPFTPLSNVESLNFHHCFIHPAFLASITPHSDDSPDTWILPKLSSLSLSDTGVPMDDLIRMIECRLACVPPHKPLLTSISLSKCRLSSLERGALQELATKHAGLQINITDN